MSDAQGILPSRKKGVAYGDGGGVGKGPKKRLPLPIRLVSKYFIWLEGI